MKTATIGVALVIALAAPVSAQTAQSDEQQIRALIVKLDSGGPGQGLATNDRIFWSGAYKRPFVRPAQGEELPGVADRKPDSQHNKTTPVRIEVAKSRDLAYEFSDSVLSYEMKDGRKVSTPISILRVWRKEAGQWKVAAHFARAHYQEPTKP
jgi:hypothetical protein